MRTVQKAYVAPGSIGRRDFRKAALLHIAFHEFFNVAKAFGAQESERLATGRIAIAILGGQVDPSHEEYGVGGKQAAIQTAIMKPFETALR